MQLDAACFYTHNTAAAKTFYMDIMGLELVTEVPGKFLSFELENGVNLAIKKAAEKRELPGAQTIFIKVSDAQKAFEILRQEDVEFYKELSEESFGWQFSVLDPDNNKIVFIQRTKQHPTQTHNKSQY